MNVMSTSSQYYIIYLSETFLDSTIEAGDKRLSIKDITVLERTTQETKKGERYACTMKAIYKL